MIMCSPAGEEEKAEMAESLAQGLVCTVIWRSDDRALGGKRAEVHIKTRVHEPKDRSLD